MEQGPWEANRFSHIQEIPQILWNPKVHYHTYKYRHLSLTSTGVFISHRAVWDHPIICNLFMTYNGIQHQKVNGMLISMPVDTPLLFSGTQTKQCLWTVNTSNNRIKLTVNRRTVCYVLIITLYMKLGYTFQAQWLSQSIAHFTVKTICILPIYTYEVHTILRLYYYFSKKQCLNNWSL
jgi:hypothetical protein